VVAALASTALLSASPQVPAEIVGENDYQISNGQLDILSRWRFTWSTDVEFDVYAYGFMGAKVDNNPWSSTAIVSSSYISQLVNSYCFSGDYSFTGYTGAGESLNEVDSDWTWLYLSNCG
jgi:hypothetical protein